MNIASNWTIFFFLNKKPKEIKFFPNDLSCQAFVKEGCWYPYKIGALSKPQVFKESGVAPFGPQNMNLLLNEPFLNYQKNNK